MSLCIHRKVAKTASLQTLRNIDKIASLSNGVMLWASEMCGREVLSVRVCMCPLHVCLRQLGISVNIFDAI